MVELLVLLGVLVWLAGMAYVVILCRELPRDG